MMMLKKDPEKRATLQQIADSEWISSNGQDKIDFKIDTQFIDNCQNNSRSPVKFGNMKRIIKKYGT